MLAPWNHVMQACIFLAFKGHGRPPFEIKGRCHHRIVLDAAQEATVTVEHQDVDLNMPAGFSSQDNTGLGGLKRINTGLSEASGHRPKSSASGSGRLSLHIPNAYPRALSPRSPGSKNVTPESSRPPSPSGSSSQQRQQQAGTARGSVFNAFKGPQVATPEAEGDVSLDGTASRSNGGTSRISTIRKDSSLITIEQPDGPYTPPHDSAGQPTEVQLRSTSPLRRPLRAIRDFFTVQKTSSSSARDFLARERNFFSWLRLSCLLSILSASLLLQLQLPDTAREYSPHKRRTEPVDWDHLPLSTKVFAGVFFALSILSLVTGLVDYLGAERELEKEQVDFDETEGVFLNDGHTSRAVHGVMVVVGVGITASAVWLIAY